MNMDRLHEEIEPVVKAGADVIVLGCTHYHWIQKEIQGIVDQRAIVIQPEEAIIKQLNRVLEQLA